MMGKRIWIAAAFVLAAVVAWRLGDEPRLFGRCDRCLSSSLPAGADSHGSTIARNEGLVVEVIDPNATQKLCDEQIAEQSDASTRYVLLVGDAPGVRCAVQHATPDADPVSRRRKSRLPGDRPRPSPAICCTAILIATSFPTRWSVVCQSTPPSNSRSWSRGSWRRRRASILAAGVRKSSWSEGSVASVRWQTMRSNR